MAASARMGGRGMMWGEEGGGTGPQHGAPAVLFHCTFRYMGCIMGYCIAGAGGGNPRRGAARAWGYVGTRDGRVEQREVTAKKPYYDRTMSGSTPVL